MIVLIQEVSVPGLRVMLMHLLGHLTLTWFGLLDLSGKESRQESGWLSMLSPALKLGGVRLAGKYPGSSLGEESTANFDAAGKMCKSKSPVCLALALLKILASF